ncbi:hypothetical protein KIN20_007437 [Parelaphostrongylus tenuis]|uniref:Uncharacterized protein n=1 Tax=Parelaphostrongylus tenuis TaxID=148309 RepID=A0AAD5M3E7_PARTN|nr:hypothetical protein KIN20_007437 [Parelaphostrongylus tenuis]
MEVSEEISFAVLMITLIFSAYHGRINIVMNELYQKTVGYDLLAFSDIHTISEHYGSTVPNAAILN